MTTIPMNIMRSDIMAALKADAEEDAMAVQQQRDAERAHQLGVEAAAEAEAKAAATAIATEFEVAEPPELVAAVSNGLSPQRARFVAFVEWVNGMQAEHDHLVLR